MKLKVNFNVLKKRKMPVKNRIPRKTILRNKGEIDNPLQAETEGIHSQQNDPITVA